MIKIISSKPFPMSVPKVYVKAYSRQCLRICSDIDVFNLSSKVVMTTSAGDVISSEIDYGDLTDDDQKCTRAKLDSTSWDLPRLDLRTMDIRSTFIQSQRQEN